MHRHSDFLVLTQNNCLVDFSSLKGCDNLVVVDVSRNRIVKLDGLHKLTKLVSLNLSGNRIERLDSSAAQELKACPSLANLDLSDNGISFVSIDSHMEIPDPRRFFLASTPNLRCLSLDVTGIQNLSTSSLEISLPHLVRLNNSQIRGISQIE